MINKGLDLTPLDPDRDPAWRERLVSEVMRHVRSSSRARPYEGRAAAWREGDTLSELLALARPSLAVVLAAATVMIVISGIGSTAVDRPAGSGARTVGQYAVAEALGMPRALASWVEEGRAPSPGELLASLGGY